MTAFTIALAGNPNCGKTTLFNALTGLKQRIGNWSGVTVEKKSGHMQQCECEIHVMDLPGTYSLSVSSQAMAPDELVACQYIFSNHAHLIVNVVDGSNLERNLYLTMQLIEMRVPMLLAINMMDVAQKHGIQIDLKKLSATLGCPVVGISAHREQGIDALKKTIIRTLKTPSLPKNILEYDQETASHIQSTSEAIAKAYPQYEKNKHFLAIRLLEEDSFALSLLPALPQDQKREDMDIIFADARYQAVKKILSQAITRQTQPEKNKITDTIDKIVLNRFLGIPIFLLVMYSLFFFSINIGGAFQDFFDISSQAIFVDGLSQFLTALHMPAWLTAIVASGIGKGINTTVTFIPVIGSLFLFLSFLENTGYMARAAFVMDRCMRALGLPGKSFVPMIVGFGCNVPAVMAARTLENKRDRILTVMMSPFMSCGARLSIYAVFTAAFFPIGGQNIVFLLYITGILMAVLTGMLLRKTMLSGEPSPLVMELPPYHLPTMRGLRLHTWQRLRNFLFKAGQLILPISVIVGALNAIGTDGTLILGDANPHSLLAALGHFVTPVFSPMGIHRDNWPATVGLITGVLAKEVVVGTLNALYSPMAHINVALQTHITLLDSLKQALLSIPQNLAELKNAFVNPIVASMPAQSVNDSVYGVMANQFDGKVGALSYLFFVLLYFPCASTVAVMYREVGKRWALFSVFWTSFVAYAVAVLFYQVNHFHQHPERTMAWIIILSAVFAATIFAMRNFSSRDQQNEVNHVSRSQKLSDESACC